MDFRQAEPKIHNIKPFEEESNLVKTEEVLPVLPMVGPLYSKFVIKKTHPLLEYTRGADPRNLSKVCPSHCPKHCSISSSETPPVKLNELTILEATLVPVWPIFLHDSYTPWYI